MPGNHATNSTLVTLPHNLTRLQPSPAITHVFRRVIRMTLVRVRNVFHEVEFRVIIKLIILSIRGVALAITHVEWERIITVVP
jgi:hypothetical protein